MQENLPELRDIHLPLEGVSIFPIAYGWWVILVGIIAVFLLFKLFKIIHQKSKKLYALRLIKNLSEPNIITNALQISNILRRICVYKYPSAITLSGTDWINFLNQHSKQKLNDNAAKLLIDAPYVPKDTQSFNQNDILSLKVFASSWIGENL